MNVLRERNMSWFGSLVNPAPKDDSLPLLSTSKKPYRDLILANAISVFDLRIYMLARQSALLNKLRHPIEICRKAMLFLSSFGKRLREVEVRGLGSVNGHTNLRFSGRFQNILSNRGFSHLPSASWINAIPGLVHGRKWRVPCLLATTQAKGNSWTLRKARFVLCLHGR